MIFVRTAAALRNLALFAILACCWCVVVVTFAGMTPKGKEAIAKAFKKTIAQRWRGYD